MAGPELPVDDRRHLGVAEWEAGNEGGPRQRSLCHRGRTGAGRGSGRDHAGVRPVAERTVRRAEAGRSADRRRLRLPGMDRRSAAAAPGAPNRAGDCGRLRGVRADDGPLGDARRRQRRPRRTVCSGRAHPPGGDVRGGRRRRLRGARRRPQRTEALRGDSRQRGPGGADRPCPAPPSFAAADPVDQRPRLDVRQPERRRGGGGDGDPVRVWSARLRRIDGPRAVTVAAPDGGALSGAGDRLPGGGPCARRLAGRGARDRGLLRAPPPPAVTRDRRCRGRGRDPGRRRGGDSRPLDRARRARRQTVRAGHAGGPRRRRSELASRPHPPGALAPDVGALPVAAAGGDRRRQLPGAFSPLRRAQRHPRRRAVADGRPAARPQRSAGAARRDGTVWSGGAAGALRGVGRGGGSSGPGGAARRPPWRRRDGRGLRRQPGRVRRLRTDRISLRDAGDRLPLRCRGRTPRGRCAVRTRDDDHGGPRRTAPARAAAGAPPRRPRSDGLRHLVVEPPSRGVVPHRAFRRCPPCRRHPGRRRARVADLGAGRARDPRGLSGGAPRFGGRAPGWPRARGRRGGRARARGGALLRERLGGAGARAPRRRRPGRRRRGGRSCARDLCTTIPARSPPARRRRDVSATRRPPMAPGPG